MKLSMEQKLSFIRDLDSGMSMTACCREHGISRTLGYRLRNRYLDDGPEGLEDRLPIPKNPANKTTVEVQNRIETAALEHPDRGAGWLSEYLAEEENVSVSAPTIWKTLKMRNLEKRERRLSKLLDLCLERGEEFLSETALQGMERISAHFAHRHFLKDKLGDMVFLFVEIGYLSGSRKRILFDIALDACGNAAFVIFDYRAFLTRELRQHFLDHRPMQDIGGLTNRLTDVLFALKTLIYDGLDIPLKSVLIPCKSQRKASGIRDLQNQVRSLGIETVPCWEQKFLEIPYVRDFRRLFREEFKENILSGIPYEKRVPYASILQIEKSLNEYLREYNQARRIRTYPNLGRSPLEYALGRQDPRVKSPVAVRIDRILPGGPLVPEEILERHLELIKRSRN